MSSTVTFYIARHGKTLMNTLERVQGWCDSPLTEEGIKVAEYLGAGLKDIHFDGVYTSDLRRTVRTAHIVLDKQEQGDLKVIEKQGFREVCFGSYEAGSSMKLWREAAIYLHYPSVQLMEKDLKEEKITHVDIMDAICKLDHLKIAETFRQMEERTQHALKEIAEQYSLNNKNSNILIVAHGLCIMVMLHHLGGKYHPKLYIDNATVCKVTYKDRIFTVESMGDDQYLKKGRELIESV